MLAVGEASAHKRRTTRSGVNRRTPPAAEAAAPTDTFIIPDSCDVRVYGYDKPLRSRRESMFLTNLTDRDIKSVTVTTQYLDLKNRKLHQSTRRVDADIPARETRRIEFPSWDTQQSFYYIGSKRSRAAGIPYDVRVSVDTIFIYNPTESCR